jgi:hypothetical protein
LGNSNTNVMKRNFLLLLSLLVLINFITAQQVLVTHPKLALTDTIPNDSLLISEVAVANASVAGLIELTNTGSDTVDLVNFFIQGRYIYRSESFLTPTENRANLEGLIPPGKSVILSIPIPNRFILDEENFPVYPGEFYANAEVAQKAIMELRGGSIRFGTQYGLYSRYRNSVTQNVDSVVIDVFNAKANDQASQQPIAGVPVQPINRHWVRKTVFKKGNIGWDNSRGNDLVDSEWMPLTPFANKYNEMPYTTLGNFDKGDLNSIQPKDGITIDLSGSTITFPYGSASRDSVFRKFNYGPGIGWDLIYGMVDSSEYYIQTGDTLLFHVLGDSIETYRFVANVLPRPNTFNKVSPVLVNEDNVYFARWDVSNNNVNDSISNLPYGVRKDTLLNYIVIEEGCSYEFIHADGVEKPDLYYGDILKITPATGPGKEYKIVPNAYKPSRISHLERVIAPGLDVFENPVTFEYGDTLHGFVFTNTVYNVHLPYDVEEVPSLLFIPVNPRANLQVTRAKNLNGTQEERTTTVLVTAEDGVNQTTYNFVFEREREQPELDYSLFFSDIGTNWGSLVNGYTMQIFNPFLNTVDFSEYFIFQSQNSVWTIDNIMSSANALKDPDQWVFRPGYRVVLGEDGKHYFSVDYNQTRTNIAPQRVFNISIHRGFPYEGEGASADLYSAVDYRVFKSNSLPFTDKITGEVFPDWYGTKLSLFHNFNWFHSARDGKSTWLYKITNDSVLEGTKPMADLVNDYELVDVINGFTYQGVPWLLYDRIGGKDTVFDQKKYDWIAASCLYRKPEIYKGNPFDRGSFGFADLVSGETIVPSEWLDYGGENWDGKATTTNPSQNRPDATSRKRLGFHEMKVTSHIPYLLSSKYIISEGITGTQTISGVPVGTAVQTLFDNVVLSNADMRVKVLTSTGVEKTSGETVTDNDVIISYSARGIDSVIYDPVLGELNSDVTLVSTQYQISVSGDKKSGVVSNVPFGITLNELMENITVPGFSDAYIVDQNNSNIPFYYVPNDTNLLQSKQRTATFAASNISIKVIAQNGDICLYSLSFAATTPILLSEIYRVDNTTKIIDFVELTSVNYLLSNLKTPAGYKVKVINFKRQNRADGTIYPDDMVLMYNENNPDESYTYLLKVTDQPLYNGISSQTNLGISVYPNPVVDVVTVTANGMKSISVRDLTGKTVMQFNVDNNEHSFRIAGKPGVYFISVQFGKQTQTLKVVKQ